MRAVPLIHAAFVSFFLAVSLCCVAVQANTQDGKARAQLASDVLIENIIKSKFARQQAFGLLSVRVHSENHVVHLTGTLVTRDAADLAMRLTMETPGVAAAFNEILLAR